MRKGIQPLTMNLNQVTLPAVELAPAIAFYQRLGLRLIVEDLPHYARFECPDGETTLSLEQVVERVDGERLASESPRAIRSASSGRAVIAAIPHGG